MRIFSNKLLAGLFSVLCTGIVAGLFSFTPAVMAKDTVDFTLPDMYDNPVKLSDFRGKWVVVNYWATWCPPCLSEIPELIDFHEEHKDKDAVVLGVDFEDISQNELQEFVEEYFMNYPNVQMKPGPRGHLGIIEGLPTTFLVSPEGKVLAKQTGPVTRKLIEKFIKGHETSKAQISTPLTNTSSTIRSSTTKVSSK